MIEAICIDKFRIGNKTTYVLQDNTGNTQNVLADTLKKAIRTRQISVINLKLTSDNRLIIKDIDPIEAKYASNQSEGEIIIIRKKLENLMLKAEIIGVPFKNWQSGCGHTFYTLDYDDYKSYEVIKTLSKAQEITGTHIDRLVWLPYEVKNPNQYGLYPEFSRCINTSILFGQHKPALEDIMIVGGSGIESAECMFKGIDNCRLNLKYMDTSRVKSMAKMFKECNAQCLDIGYIDTTKVTDMHEMFAECKTEYINIAHFNNVNVTTMRQMFDSCTAKYINMGDFDIYERTDTKWMFTRCNARIKTKNKKIINEYNRRNTDNLEKKYCNYLGITGDTQ